MTVVRPPMTGRTSHSALPPGHRREAKPDLRPIEAMAEGSTHMTAAPDQAQVVDDVFSELRRLRLDRETFNSRRGATVRHAHSLGPSLREIGSNIGLSPQGVKNILDRSQ